MKKSAMAAVGLVTVAAVSGGAAQAGLASADSAAAMHTKRYVLKEVASKNFSQTTFGGSDRIKSKATGEVVGYDSYTGRFYPKQEKAVIRVGIALRGGIIAGRVVFRAHDNGFSGPILKGTGRFAGIDGTINGHESRKTGRTVVVLRYHL